MAERDIGFWKLARTYSGFFSAVVLNLGSLGIKLNRTICAPAFNCHGCPWSSTACPIGVMAYGSAVRTFPAMAVGLVLAVGAVLGRAVCGFACPFGWFQDLLFRIPTRKFRLPRWTRWLKYAALALLVVALPLALGFKYSGPLKVGKPQPDKNAAGNLDVGVRLTNFGTEPIRGPALDAVFRDNETKQETDRTHREFPEVTVPPGGSVELPKFEMPNKLATANLEVTSPQSTPHLGYHYQLYYCRVCPKGSLTAALPSAVGGEQPFWSALLASPLRFGLLPVFLVLMILVSRGFCQTFCPLGAIYGLCSRLALLRITLDTTACVNCGLCSRVCPVDLDVPREVGGRECIACGDCIRACPKGGIRRQVGF